MVKLLAFLNEKDLFAEFFKVPGGRVLRWGERAVSNCVLSVTQKKLGKRLLGEKSSNDDHERSILSRLKQQCGAQFTSKV